MFAQRSHGFSVKSFAKLVVRLGMSRLNELNRNLQWPTPAGTVRRVSAAMAARRQRPDHAGHDAPERGLNPASARPTPSALRFHFLDFLPRPLLQPFPHQEPPAPLLTTARPHCSSATAIAPPSPQQLQTSPIARCSSLVSRSNAHAFAGVRRRVPSSWPRRCSLPFRAIAGALGPP